MPYFTFVSTKILYHSNKKPQNLNHYAQKLSFLTFYLITFDKKSFCKTHLIQIFLLTNVTFYEIIYLSDNN